MFLPLLYLAGTMAWGIVTWDSRLRLHDGIEAADYSMAIWLVGSAAVVYGLLFAIWSLARHPGRREHRFLRPVPSHSLSLMLLLGSGLVLAATYAATGVIPALSSQPGVDKYFQDDLSAYRPFRPFYAIAQNVLMVVALIPLFHPPGARGRAVRWLTIPAILLLVTTAKRGPPFIALLGFWFDLVSRRRWLPAFGILALGLFALPALSGEGLSTIALRSVLVIPLELARLIEADPPLYHGATYLFSPLTLLPRGLFPLKGELGYTNAVLLALGETDTEASGGPRAGFVGEGLLNFGLFGAIIVGPVLLFLVALFYNRVIRRFTAQTLGVECAMYYSIVVAFIESGSASILFAVIRMATLIIMAFPHLVVRPEGFLRRGGVQDLSEASA